MHEFMDSMCKEVAGEARIRNGVIASHKPPCAVWELNMLVHPTKRLNLDSTNHVLFYLKI